MAYIYQVSFDIRPEQMEQLQIGSSMARVVGYLRTLLPGEPGYITSRAIYSLDTPELVHLIFESVWDNWDSLKEHLRTSLAENKVLAEFEPHVTLTDLSTHLYSEVP